MQENQDGVIRDILGFTRRIAVVGLSDKPHRDSHQVASTLADLGYDIVPVNPNITGALGKPAYPSLADVTGKVDLVNVFRRPEHAAEVVRHAAEVGARAVWLQEGIVSVDARKAAEDAGLAYVEDVCLGHQVQRLRGQMLLPAPSL